jgi:hypothetical protein
MADSPGAGILGGSRPAPPPATSDGAIYVGVEAGSDLEKYGYQGAGANQPGASLAAKYGPAKGFYGKRLPLYKRGYQNSEQFRRELGNMDPNIIYLYQQRLHDAGMLDAYTPGQLDKPTRAAFKEVLSQANQSASSWQSTLQSIESVGGVFKEPEPRDPFQAVLDDPASLKAAFQHVAQDIYGGDLPDSEVDAMVDAYRTQQLQKQKAAYDAEGTTTTIEKEADPSAFAADQLKATHPDQLERVKFSSAMSTIMQGLAGRGAQ